MARRGDVRCARRAQGAQLHWRRCREQATAPMEDEVDRREQYVTLHHFHSGVNKRGIKDVACHARERTIPVSGDLQQDAAPAAPDVSFADPKFGPEPPPSESREEGGSAQRNSGYDTFFHSSMRLQKMILYETTTRFYLVGYTKEKNYFRVLKVHKSGASTSVDIDLDPQIYSGREVQKLLYMIHDGNRHAGGLKKTTTSYGIIGFVKFIEGYYLFLVSKRRHIGSIGCHHVYAIDRTAYVPLFQPRGLDHEQRYKQLFFGMDLTDFYFSYSYDLTHSLQHNITSSDPPMHDDRFVWNHFLAKPLIQAVGNSSAWILPMIHGYFRQRSVSLTGHIVRVTVIARRSRHFAGTRFLKRGVNEQGRVANDVETEQIIEDVSHGTQRICAQRFSSYVQIRGSIPLYWGQAPRITDPKPPIFIQRFDPFYTAAMLHFQDLFRRFGAPIVVVNLVKAKEKVPRESILRNAFEAAVQQINTLLPEHSHIHYIPFDFHANAKNKDSDVIAKMEDIAMQSLERTGFFYSDRERHRNKVHGCGETFTYGGIDFEDKLFGRLQKGVLRSNCIDSLDRTNAAQYVAAKVVFGHQLYTMGLVDNPHLTYEHPLAVVLMDLYQEKGNRLALQYGGSHLAHTMKTYQEKSLSSQGRDFLTTIRRYYSNSFVDKEKQDSINIFLGNFIPYQEKTALWDLETDYYLHVKGGAHRDQLMSSLQWWTEPLATFARKKRRPVSYISNIPVHELLSCPIYGEDAEKEQNDDVPRYHYYDGAHDTKRMVSFDKILSLPHNVPELIYSGQGDVDGRNSEYYLEHTPLTSPDRGIERRRTLRTFHNTPSPRSGEITAEHSLASEPASNSIQVFLSARNMHLYEDYCNVDGMLALYEVSAKHNSEPYYSSVVKRSQRAVPVFKESQRKVTREYPRIDESLEAQMLSTTVDEWSKSLYARSCSFLD